MAKKISYDPDTITSLISACATAKNDLDNAANSLGLIKSHADWTCKEKDDIDDMVDAMKKLLKSTQDNQNSYFVAIKRIAELYLGKETIVGGLISNLDGLIGRILSIKASVISTIGQKIGVSSGKSLSDIVSSTHETVSNIVSGMRKFIEGMQTGIHIPHLPVGIPTSPISPSVPIIPHIPNPILPGQAISSNGGLADIIGTGLPNTHSSNHSGGGIPICRFPDIASSLKS